MAGTFQVVGTFLVPGRGLLAYGDIVTGDVRPGELLVIPLNGSTGMSAMIRSVEAVDGTSTGSHVGLLLGEDDLEVDILAGLGFEGEPLTVSPAGIDVYASRMGFDEAKLRLIALLVRLRWPREIAWIDESQLTSFPQRVFVFLPRGRFEDEQAVREKFETALARCPAVRLAAIGKARDLTLAAVWPIDELAQGEAMFVEHGVKIDVPAAEPLITITRSRLRWWLIRRAYHKWMERRDAALGTASERDCS
jgi:hypothetical protein